MPKYIVALLLSSLIITSQLPAQTTAAEPAGITYEVLKTFKVGGAGGWDYITFDPITKHLYVPRSTHTMVIDSADGKVIADIAGQKHNHGVALVPSVGRGFISDDASVVIFDLKSNEVLGRIDAAEDADGILYDADCNKVLVGCGDAHVMIPIAPDVDPKSGKADAAIELGGKPESAAAGNGKIYVNLVDRSSVAVIDSKTMKVEHKWPTAPAGGPAGLAMDVAHHKLFVGCRNPAKMIVMSSDDGKVLADLPIGPGVDFCSFADDAFASCRDGTLAVARANAAGVFEIAQSVKTKVGSRTMCVDPATHMAYLPAAEMKTGPGRPQLVKGTFAILVVGPKN